MKRKEKRNFSFCKIGAFPFFFEKIQQPTWIQNSNEAPEHHATETVEACYTCFLVSNCALLLSSSLFSLLALKFNFSYLLKSFSNSIRFLIYDLWENPIIFFI